MQDDVKFDEWNEIKKGIDKTISKDMPQMKKIYWVQIGQNIGSEVFGKGGSFSRPVLVIRVFYNNSFLGVPLSSQIYNKTGKLYHKFKDSRKKVQVALLAQLRVFDNKRKYRYIGKINEDDFEIVKEKLKNIIG